MAYNMKRLYYAHYCSEDLSNIENYAEAILPDSGKWICHHRNEIVDGVHHSVQELIDKDLYYNRPASELIFMKYSEHSALHRLGTKWSEDVKAKMKKQHNLSDDMREQNKARCKGKTWKLINGRRHWVEVKHE